MKDIGYVIKRLFHMDYGAMFKKINSATSEVVFCAHVAILLSPI